MGLTEQRRQTGESFVILEVRPGRPVPEDPQLTGTAPPELERRIPLATDVHEDAAARLGPEPERPMRPCLLELLHSGMDLFSERPVLDTCERFDELRPGPRVSFRLQIRTLCELSTERRGNQDLEVTVPGVAELESSDAHIVDRDEIQVLDQSTKVVIDQIDCKAEIDPAPLEILVESRKRLRVDPRAA